MNWNELNIDEMSVGELLDAIENVARDVPRVFLHDNRSDDISEFRGLDDDEIYVSRWWVENRLAQIQTRLRYLLSL